LPRVTAPLVVLLVIVDLVPRVGPLLQSAPFDPHLPYARVVGRDGKIGRIMPPKLSTIDRRAWIAGYLNLFEHRFDAWTAAPVVSESYTRVDTTRSPGAIVRDLSRSESR